MSRSSQFYRFLAGTNFRHYKFRELISPASRAWRRNLSPALRVPASGSPASIQTPRVDLPKRHLVDPTFRWRSVFAAQLAQGPASAGLLSDERIFQQDFGFGAVSLLQPTSLFRSLVHFPNSEFVRLYHLPSSRSSEGLYSRLRYEWTMMPSPCAPTLALMPSGSAATCARART